VHASSYEKMEGFRHRHLGEKESESLLIYDLGSQDVNGTYRPIFDIPTWQYIGIDMDGGANVDTVLHTPYAWREIRSRSVDVVVSGQAFEHIEFFWITMLEIARVLKPGGICCIIAPSSGPEHRYPTDCWRFYPDGFSALAHFAQLEVLEVSAQWGDKGYADCSDMWHDALLICRRPQFGFWLEVKSRMKRSIQHWAMTIGVR
jgi:SAM-dependent methyltransferase